MGNEGRESRSERRRKRGADRERLAAAEARIDELLAARDQLAAELVQSRAEFGHALEALNVTMAERQAALEAQAKEDYRRQVGVLDIVRRQQKRQDETFGARVDAAEQAVAAVGAEQAERSARLESRTEHLETTTRVAVNRIEAFAAFQVELGTIIERINATIRAIRESVERLGSRADTLEALSREQLADHTALREQVSSGQKAHDLLAETVRRVASVVNDLDGRSHALSAAVAPLGVLPDQVLELAELVNNMNDRVIAAELVLNQRNDLDLQLERAEEFERVLAEADPSAWALREDLETLRRRVEALTPNGHAE